MNFIVKQTIKSKTAGITNKLDDLNKKCKDLVKSEDSSTAPDPAVQQSEEEKAAKIAEARKAHYAAINAEREEQRQRLRDKYGLNKPGESSKSDSESTSINQDSELGGRAEKEADQNEEEKKDCNIM